MKKIVTVVLTVALTLTLAIVAQASVLSLDGTGSLGGATVLTTSGGSAPLGADTSFSYHAIFDSTGGTEIPGFEGFGIYQYSAVTTFALAGYGTYTSSLLFVMLADPTSAYSSYATGIFADVTNDIVNFYGTASPPFAGNAPTPSVLSNLGAKSTMGALTFDGGVTLSNLKNGSAIPTTAITTVSAVPEVTSSFTLLAMVAGGLLVRRRTQHLR